MSGLAVAAKLGLRYAAAVRGGGYGSFLSLSAIIAMALGVASLVIVLSVMNGFERELQGRLLRLLPELTLHHHDGIDSASAGRTAAQLSGLDGVRAAYPQLVAPVMVAAADRQRGALLRSYDSRHESLLDERQRALLSRPYSVLVGSQLARQLGLRYGDSLTVTLPRVATTPFGVFPRSRRLIVVGSFALGAQLDSSALLVSLQSADKLFGGTAPERLVAVDLEPTVKLEQFIASHPAAAQSELHGASWQPWYASFASFFAAVALEKRVVAVLLSMIVVVAGFNIVATLSMTVTAKRKEIAVLRTAGLRRGQVVAALMVQGGALGGLGLLLGLLVGVPVAATLPEIAAFIERLGDGALLDPTVYMINALPSQLEWQDVAATASGALLLISLATLLPAWRAGTILPAEALRYDR